MSLLTEGEILEFERLCDIQGVPPDKRAQIIREVFGKAEARLYSERQCRVLPFKKAVKASHLR